MVPLNSHSPQPHFSYDSQFGSGARRLESGGLCSYHRHTLDRDYGTLVEVEEAR